MKSEHTRFRIVLASEAAESVSTVWFTVYSVVQSVYTTVILCCRSRDQYAFGLHLAQTTPLHRGS
jgi:hypothetical protein